MAKKEKPLPSLEVDRNQPKNVVQRLKQNAQRLRNVLQGKNVDTETPESFFKYFYPLKIKNMLSPFVSQNWPESTLLIENATELFGPEPTYYITSSMAWDDLTDDKAIIPPSFHRGPIGIEVETHRGAGLPLWEKLCWILNIETSGKARHIWTSRDIDQDQLANDDWCAKQGNARLNQQIFDTFFVKGENTIVLNDRLKRIFQNLLEHKSQNEEEVDVFCREVSLYFNIRDGWHIALKNALMGKSQDTIRFNQTDMIEDTLCRSYEIYPEAKEGKTQQEAIILKVDVKKNCERQGNLSLFPLGTRHPRWIIPLNYLLIDDVITLYVRDPQEFRKTHAIPQDIELKSFAEIPEKDWIGGKYLPDHSVEEINFRDPMCLKGKRYGKDAANLMYDHVITKGHGAFVGGPIDLSHQVGKLFVRCFGSKLFGNDFPEVSVEKLDELGEEYYSMKEIIGIVAATLPDVEEHVYWH